MTLSDDETVILGRLTATLPRKVRHNRIRDAYYDGEQRIEQLGLAIPPELRRFLTIVAWPGTYVDAVEERIDLEGFRLPDMTEADEDLWRIWQDNDLDQESQLAHLDALVRGQAYVIVGAGDSDSPDTEDLGDDRDPASPLVTVESSDEVAVELSARTREVAAAAKLYRDGLDLRATLYLPDVTIWLERPAGRWVDVERDEHELGTVPVVPLVNRPRLDRRAGRSQIDRVISLTDAAARALTNAQLATEIMAIPQRWVVGASKGDFVDKDGQMLTTWESYFGAIWALKNGDAKVGSFSAADLSNFSGIVNHYAALVAGVTGLPMRYLGQLATNPPSAEGIRADEARIIKTCERFERSAEGSWERVMRLARRIVDGDWNTDLRQLETLWRDPATPTRAQAADAVLKLVQGGILPVEAAWEDLGYSAVRRRKLKEMREAEVTLDPIAGIARALEPGTAQPPVGADTGEPADAVAG